MSVKGLPANNPANLIQRARVDVERQTKGATDIGPAGSAALTGMISDAVDKQVKTSGAQLAASDLAALKAQVATDLAASIGDIGKLGGAAQQAAQNMKAAEGIVAREDAIFAKLGKAGPAEHKANPGQLTRDLAGLLDAASQAGAYVAHDSWFAASIGDTVQGDKANDLTGLGKGGLRARPFMAPSDVILESGDKALIETMQNNNVGGVKATLAGLVDALGGGIPDGVANYTEAAAALPDRFANAQPSGGISAESRSYLQNLGHELSSVRQTFAEGGVPDWGKFPAARAALAATHDRYIQANPWASDDQKVPFGKLSAQEQARDIPVLMAALHGINEAQVVSQAGLKQLVGDKNPPKLTFVKDQPITMFPLTKESVNAIPESILSKMGAIDNATYGDNPKQFREFLEGRIGGAIVLQFADGKPDFYPTSPEVFANKYKAVAMDSLEGKNPKLFASFKEEFGGAPAGVPGVISALKVAPVEMYRASDLGFKKDEPLEIAAPWGGTQTKPAGQDAYIVANGNEMYMVNVDKGGLPIAYLPHEG